MKTKYRYIHFEKSGGGLDNSGKPGWWCRNNNSDDTLGTIVWFPAWRQHVFSPCKDTIYSVDCMLDIIDFINNQID
jgi:hypothetical protein